MKAEKMLDNMSNYVLSGVPREDAIDAMKRYAEMKCNEQREIIATELPDRCFIDMDESNITSMRKPNFE